MFRALITSIPFQRIPSLANQEWNALPHSILHDITQFIHLERLFYPNKPSLYNTKPFIHIAKDVYQYSIDSIPLPEYKPLSQHYFNTYLIDTFSRDLSVYNNPDNKLLISRNWIDYNQHSKLLRILSVQELFDYHIEFARYLEYLNTQCNPPPNFDSRDVEKHTKFLAQLRKLH
jgi:hypothetical protein